MNIIVYQGKRAEFHLPGLLQRDALVAQVTYERNDMVLFELLANNTKYLVAVLQVYRAGSCAEMAGNGGHNHIFILCGADICFEDADHVPDLNNFRQNSFLPGIRAYIKRIIIYT